MEELIQPFFICFSIASCIAIYAVHKYLYWKLGSLHDKGYLYMAIAFGFWAAMAITENWVPPEKEDHALRIIFSALNNSFLVLSLSFIDHGWSKFSSGIQKLGWSLIAVIIGGTTLIVGSLDGQKNHMFAWVDAFWSVLVLTLLFIGMIVTFMKPERNMKVMVFFSGITGFLFVFTQLFVLSDYGHLNWGWLHAIPGHLIRMLTRPMLLVCILTLALTWLGAGGHSEEGEQLHDAEDDERRSGEDKLVQEAIVEVAKTPFDKREEFINHHGIIDEDLVILRRLAEGESVAEIAKDLPMYGGDSKKLQNRIASISKKFGMNGQKQMSMILFAIKEGGLDIDAFDWDSIMG